MKTLKVNQKIGKTHFSQVLSSITRRSFTFDNFDFIAIVPNSYSELEVKNLERSVGLLDSDGDKSLHFFTSTLLSLVDTISNSAIFVREYMYEKDFTGLLIETGIEMYGSYYYRLPFQDNLLIAKILSDLHSTGLLFGFVCEIDSHTQRPNLEDAFLFFTDCFDGEYEIIAKKRLATLPQK